MKIELGPGETNDTDSIGVDSWLNSSGPNSVFRHSRIRQPKIDFSGGVVGVKPSKDTQLAKMDATTKYGFRLQDEWLAKGHDLAR